MLVESLMIFAALWADATNDNIPTNIVCTID